MDEMLEAISAEIEEKNDELYSDFFEASDWAEAANLLREEIKYIAENILAKDENSSLGDTLEYFVSTPVVMCGGEDIAFDVAIITAEFGEIVVASSHFILSK